jgi:hypothetical protein
MDPDAEDSRQQLDSFSLILPLPYRVALIIVLGPSLAILSAADTKSSKECGRGVSICTTCISSKLYSRPIYDIAGSGR